MTSIHAMSQSSPHAVVRYSREILCGLSAAATLVISWMCNWESAPWLFALYTTVAVLLATLRDVRGSRMNRSFAIYLVNLAGYLFVVWCCFVMVPGKWMDETRATNEWWLNHTAYGMNFSMIAQFHFTLTFAGFRSRTLRGIEALGWLAGLYFCYLSATNVLVTQSMWTGHSWVPGMTRDYQHFFVYISLCLIASLLTPIVGMFTHRNRNRRLQILFYLIGAAPLWLSCWGHFLISAGINIFPLGGFMFMFHIAVIAFAVIKYRAFQVTIRIRRGLAYAVCCVLIGAIYAAISIALWNSGVQSTHGLPFRVALVIVLILICAPLLGLLQKGLDAFFFRASVDRERLLERFARESSASLDLSRVGRGLCEALNQGLQPSRVDLYLKPSGDAELALFGTLHKEYESQQWPSKQRVPSNVEQALAGQSSARPVKALAAPKDSRVFRVETGDEALAVPIIHSSERLGCIVLGPKHADEAFTPDDIRFAETIAASASNALQNARAFSQLERLQKLAEGVLNSLSTGVVLLTRSGEVVTANAAARQICSGGETFPKSLKDLWENQPILASAIRRAVDHHDFRENDELRLEGAEAATVLFSTHALRVDASGEMVVAIMHDITDYKRVKAIAERNENLARIGEAVASINHEIKNLLQPIHSQIERLVGVDRSDTSAIRDELGRTSAVVPGRLAALERMMTNLKNISRPLTLRLHTLEIEPLVRGVWEDVRGETPTQTKLGVEFSDVASEVSADGHWMRQVIYNLLRNATEATAGRSRPHVSVRGEIQSGQYLLSIEDNGRGMDPGEKSKLFEPFFSTKGEAGAGLGLCVARKIVEAHGGSIRIESEPGRTNVVMSLPMREIERVNASV